MFGSSGLAFKIAFLALSGDFVSSHPGLGDQIAAGIGLSHASFANSSATTRSTLFAYAPSPTTMIASTANYLRASSTAISGAATSSTPSIITTKSNTTTSSMLLNSTYPTSMSLSSAWSNGTTFNTTAYNSTSNATSSSFDCLSALFSYSAVNSSWNAQPGHTTTEDYISIRTEIAPQSTPPSVQPYTTLCDGWPRATETWDVTIVTSSYSYALQRPSVITPFPQAPPSCSLDQGDCDSWCTSHWSCSASSSVNYADDSDIDDSCRPYLINEPCTQPSDFSITSRPDYCTGDGFGTIFAYDLELHYWPVTRTRYNLCNMTGGTITGDQRTAVVSGTTITSPDVGLYFPSIYALDLCGTIGPVSTNIVVTIPETDISSNGKLGMRIVATSWSFNYGDLAPNPVPSSAWFNQDLCASELLWTSTIGDLTGAAYTSSFGQLNPECGTIWENNYQPDLAAPTQINDLNPLWADCTALFGLADPPIALTAAASAAQLTVPGASPFTQAPGPSPTANVAQQTSAAAALQGPTTPAARPTEVSSSGQQTALPDQVSPNAPNGPSTPNDSQQQQSASDPGNSQPGGVGGGSMPSAITVLPGQSGQQVTVAQQDSSVVVVAGGSTAAVAPGSTVTVAGQPVAVPPSGGSVVVGSQTVALSPAAAIAPAPILTLAPQLPNQPVTLSQQGSSVVVENSGSVTTITPGQQAIINGQTVSVPVTGRAVLVDSSTIAFAGSQSTVLNIGQQFTGHPATIQQEGSAIIIADGESVTTLAPGQQAVISGQTVSVPSIGGGLIVGSSTLALGGLQSSIFTFGQQPPATIIREGSSVIISQNGAAVTLAPGAQTTIDGQLVSVPASGSGLVVGGSTLALGGQSTVLTLGQQPSNQSATILRDGSSIILSQGGTAVTLAPGSQATFEGQVVSLDSSDGVLVMGSSRIPLPVNTVSAPVAFVTAPSGRIVELQELGSGVVVADRSRTYTLSAGAQTVIDGETISVPRSSGLVVLDGSIVTLSAASSTASCPRNGTTASTTSSSLVATVSGVARPAATTSKKGDASRTSGSMVCSLLLAIWCGMVIWL